MNARRCLLLMLALGLLAGAAAGDAAPPAFESARVPKLTISNGALQALVLLPDAENGYYRGTRFDWSGLVARVTFKGHTYFGEWQTPHNPGNHDDVVGPAEEFGTVYPGSTGPLGYAEAKAGEDFVKIGVGLLRKVEEPAYRFWFNYPIVKPGQWRVRHGASWVEFRQELSSGSGWRYTYTKRITLTSSRPEMVITHSLRNTGAKPLATSHYCHNFTRIDDEPVGPGYRVRFPFPVTMKADPEGRAEVHGNVLTFPRTFEGNDSVYAELSGFSTSARDNEAIVENLKSRAGVRIQGDRPLHLLHFWAVRTAACPEPFVQMRLAPGQHAEWQTKYTFYELKGSGAASPPASTP